MGRLEDKVAIVTGGASGLGLAIARRFVGEGARVTITDINETDGQIAAEKIGASFVRQDVTDEVGWDNLLNTMAHDKGALHILVNNAGIADSPGEHNPELTTLSSWNRIMAVNAGGVFLGCKYVIPSITRSGGGSIINLSSIAALVATPFLTAYGASKAAVCQLSKSVAIHCAELGNRVRCNSIHPGQVMTPMLEGLLDEVGAASGQSAETMRSEFLKKIPQGEFQTADDIANTALYLASDESIHVTGQQLVVDGGMQYFR